MGDVAAVFENDDERDLHAARVGGRFYQTALDEMMACNPEDMDVVTPRINREAASVSNPDGYDFQAHGRANRVVNPDHVWRNCARLAALGAADAAHAAPITPAGRQRVLPFIVRRYLTAQREWRRSHREWDALPGGEKMARRTFVTQRRAGPADGGRHSPSAAEAAARLPARRSRRGQVDNTAPLCMICPRCWRTTRQTGRTSSSFRRLRAVRRSTWRTVPPPYTGCTASV